MAVALMTLPDVSAGALTGGRLPLVVRWCRVSPLRSSLPRFIGGTRPRRCRVRTSERENLPGSSADILVCDQIIEQLRDRNVPPTNREGRY
ncbi:MAG: hypothetical protein GF315_03615 [candidate division Zixibacteria bacterium]|nr:hypothetical protein [candidate division Zixibacteria bacterium]